MATVPIYIAKIAADTSSYREPWDIRSQDWYIATMLMPNAIRGQGRTPEGAKEDLRAQMIALFKEHGIIEIQNDTLEV